MKGITVAISSGLNQIKLPTALCPCCMGLANTSDRITHEWTEGARRGTLSLSVPMCMECFAHRTKADEHGCGLLFVGLVGFLIMIFGYATRSEIGIVGLLLILATALFHWSGRASREKKASESLQPTCTSLRVMKLGKIR